MILLINTFITDTFIPGRTSQQKVNNRVFLKSYSAFDVFKYSLASLAKAYNWKRVILCISLDNNYLDRKEELIQFINAEFGNVPFHLFWKRNVYQKEWQTIYELLDDELIWFSCNHDHIFLDSSQDYLNTIVSAMMKEADNRISCCYTHWPEHAAYVSKNKASSELNIHEEYATMNMVNVDSINIISKSIYKMWWFSNVLPTTLQFPRTDWPHNMIFNFVNCGSRQKYFIPFKELSRHFDAYYHLNMHKCPALNIPDGFFENNIKISIGNPKRIEGYTWFNPSTPNYNAEDVNGVDYKWLQQDIPIGWRSRITDVKIEPHVFEVMVNARLQGIVDMLYNNDNEKLSFNQLVINSIFNVWLKPYGLVTA